MTQDPIFKGVSSVIDEKMEVFGVGKNLKQSETDTNIA